jgi:septum formation protein
MQKANSNSHIILASKSPRRKQLLEQAGLSFSVVPSSFDEKKIPLSKPADYVACLAQAKAENVARIHTKEWIIGADTIVVINNTIIGKPVSRADARAMLKRLSGQTHQVYTGYAICNRSKTFFFVDSLKTDVHFKKLTDEEVEWYVHTKEPFDKAGAYAIQGLGAALIKTINGSYTNVVGLPICEVMDILLTHKIINRTNHTRQTN